MKELTVEVTFDAKGFLKEAEERIEHKLQSLVGQIVSEHLIDTAIDDVLLDLNDVVPKYIFLGDVGGSQ